MEQRQAALRAGGVQAPANAAQQQRSLLISAWPRGAERRYDSAAAMLLRRGAVGLLLAQPLGGCRSS